MIFAFFMVFTSFLKLGFYSCCTLKIESHLLKVKEKAKKDGLCYYFFHVA